jgi:hypothetical protein
VLYSILLAACKGHPVVQDFQAALDAVGVAYLKCNPITDSNAAKALLRVAQAESMPLSKEQALQIAHSAAGDLRHGLEMLQLLCRGQAPIKALPGAKKVRGCLLAFGSLMASR